MLAVHPRVVLAISFVLVLVGALAPFLMIIHLLPTSFASCFLSYGASIAGLLLGLVGMALKAETKPA